MKKIYYTIKVGSTPAPEEMTKMEQATPEEVARAEANLAHLVHNTMFPNAETVEVSVRLGEEVTN